MPRAAKCSRQMDTRRVVQVQVPVPLPLLLAVEKAGKLLVLQQHYLKRTPKSKQGRSGWLEQQQLSIAMTAAAMMTAELRVMLRMRMDLQLLLLLLLQMGKRYDSHALMCY